MEADSAAAAPEAAEAAAGKTVLHIIGVKKPWIYAEYPPLIRLQACAELKQISTN